MCVVYSEQEGIFIGVGDEICLNFTVTFMEMVMDFFRFILWPCQYRRPERNSDWAPRYDDGVNFKISAIRYAELVKIFKF